MKSNETWLPLFVSLFVTPVCLFLAYITVGPMGHGSFFLPKILFPYASLSLLASDNIVLTLLLAAVQFPLYGIMLSIASTNQALGTAFSILCIIHILAVILSFMYVGM